MSPTATACRHCADGLAHCHATWIRHVDGHEECLVVSCTDGADAHDIVVVCRELEPGCCR